MSNAHQTNRMIQIEGGVIGPREPRPRTVKIKRLEDYPGTSKYHLEVLETYANPLMGGGIPICDESVALVEHMFTEEEASIMRHLKPGKKETVASLAAAAHRAVEEVQKILDVLADEKSIIVSVELSGQKIYLALPILPGAFEYVLIRRSMDTLSDWHRRFCVLFERLYETGYAVETSGSIGVKYLPVGLTIASSPMAYPSDKLEEIFSRYDTFGVTLCQCRIAEEVVGRGCGKPKEVCIAMGPGAARFIQKGRMRRIEMKEALEIKAEAEANGLVSWIEARDPKLGGSSCSCCGCCCHMMRRISEFNVPGRIAPPHFIPKIDYEKCNYCGKCALACPMGAVTVDIINKKYAYDPKRCVGCAQCAIACSKLKAIAMEAVPKYEEFLQNSTRSLLTL